MTRTKKTGTKRRTILYLDHTAKMGGGEIALLNLLCALDKMRYRPIVVLAAEGPLVGKLQACGIETHVEPLCAAVLDTRKDALGAGSLLKLRQGWDCVMYARTLARLARLWGADLIHTNSLKSDLYGGLAGRMAGIPVLWHIRDSIDGHYLPPKVAAAFRAISYVLPQAVVANSHSTLRTLRSPKRQVTAAVYSGLRNTIPASDREAKVRVVHDGYDAVNFHVSEGEQHLTGGGSTIALVGRIAEWKGQHIFIEAADLVRSRFPAARFQIIGAPLFGEQEYEQRLHTMVRDRALEAQVAFLGFRDDVPALLCQANIVVHASILGEPFGQVVIEGMAAGKPVIATDGGALPEIVIPGETGLLVPMGDAPAMAEAIMQLLADPVRAAALGAAGQRRVRETFTIAHTLRALEEVYDQMLGVGS